MPILGPDEKGKCYKRSATRAYRKYKCSTGGIKHLSASAVDPNNTKVYVATLGNYQIKVNKAAIVIDEVKQFYSGRNELVNRLLADKCELCGSKEQIEVHHIKKLADIKKRYEGRKNPPPPWIKFMIARNRKTVVVCKKCHVEIHGGRYDGAKVK